MKEIVLQNIRNDKTKKFSAWFFVVSFVFLIYAFSIYPDFCMHFWIFSFSMCVFLSSFALIPLRPLLPNFFFFLEVDFKLLFSLCVILLLILCGFGESCIQEFKCVHAKPQKF